ncbi:MAG: type I 3-dehydroquinate dehydratase [Candidatus Diapherotrites archaeon]|nr:type I 3-dehydroquinate dehydratase [Candidatus Diapherotrites archaeon]
MLCNSVKAASVEEALQEIVLAQKSADCIELCLDEIKDVDEKNLPELISACEKKVVVSVREKTHGGKFEESAEKKILLLKKAVECGADFVEIDSEMQSESFVSLKKSALRKTRFIHAHYFTRHTPAQIELIKKAEELSKLKQARIVKIVTRANVLEDNSVVIGLIKESKKMGINIIAHCEGAFGRDSRILSLPFGAFLTYTTARKHPLPESGEINVLEMKKIYAGLKLLL